MEIIITLLVTVLFYKIKLIDDREQKNYERFKNYCKIRNNPKNGLYEQDAWLDKDIPFQLMGMYRESESNEGEKHAILDYYRDYNDNQQAKSDLIWLINLEMIYLILLKNGIIDMTSPKLLLEIALAMFTIKKCLVEPNKISLFNFNNRLVNVANSVKSKKIYGDTQQRIEKDISEFETKYDVKKK